MEMDAIKASRDRPVRRSAMLIPRAAEETLLSGMIFISGLLSGHESQHTSPRHQAEVNRWDWLHVRDQEEPEKRSRPSRHPQVRPGDRPPR